ncbi:uncharacterized protein LOC133178499 [Saccostrea echinata]|uniref:uncharacterized protein LOC133178499 n=1 Tax=Saccostrea echinata TaxID=191078 RepID=UPI002A8301FE|nr:uncharacterized protein LOC133178499 [Saccostrea echinata]
MAAAKKMRLDDEQSVEVEGYVHNVSPIKVSRNNNNYFNAVFQDEEKYTDLVCFVPEYNGILKEMEKTKSPVSLSKIEKTVSARTGAYDIKVTSKSKVSAPARQLKFRFEDPDIQKLMTINEAKGLNPFQKITIQGKVMNKTDPSLQTIKSGEIIKRSYVTVADASDTIQVCAWDKHIDQLDLAKSYRFTAVSLRSFDGIKSITTCPDTNIQEIPDLGFVKAGETDAISVTDTMTIDSVSCNSLTLCTACNKDIGLFNPSINTVKCQNCHMRQKTANLHKTFKIQVNCKFASNAQPKKMSISHSVLSNFTETSELKSENQIEDYFLSKTNFKVEVTPSKSQILKILEAN